MKFGLSFEKKNAANLGTVRGHNERLHPTKSQLPQEAWYSAKAVHVVQPWRESLIKDAKALKKRTDAVLAIEFSFQVGNQTDWRDLPTAEHPYGKPLPGASARMNALVKATKAAVLAEFGQDRIVSMVLHADESTPHVQVVVVPIRDGKLEAKHWTGGTPCCERLRARLHAEFEKIVPCEYDKGAPGGAPIDKSKAAGGPAAPQPKPPKKGFLDKLAEAVDFKDELKLVKAEVVRLGKQIQTLFSQLKRAQLRAANADEKREAAEAKAKDAERETAQARHTIKKLEREIERIAPYAPEKVIKPLPSGLLPREDPLPSPKPSKAPRAS